MKRITLFRAASMVVAAFFASCDTSYFDNETEELILEIGAQLPIGTTEWTLSELFEELKIEDLDQDANANYIFEDVISMNGASVDAFDVDIEDITISSSIATPITAADILPFTFPFSLPAVIPPNLQNKTDSDQIIHDLNLTQELTGADFDDGTMVISFTSTFDADVTLTLEIPSFYEKTGNRDENSYEDQVTLNGAETKQLVVNLNQYNADFTHDGGAFDATNNKVVLNLNATFSFKAGDVLNSTDQISYSAVLSNASSEVIRGDFQQEAFEIPNTEEIALDFFDNFGEGSITFADASLTLVASNGYGFPIGIDLSNITATNDGGGSMSLKYDGNTAEEQSTTTPSEREAMLILNGLTNYTAYAPGVENTTVLDKSNSNINELLSSKPSKINLNVSGTANPIDAAPNLNFYSSQNSGFEVEVNINVPLNVKFENIEQTKEMEFQGKNDIPKELTSVTLILETINEIPLSGNIEVEFKDEFGNPVVLFDENGVELEIDILGFKAAEVDAMGKSSTATTSTDELVITDIEGLKRVTDVDLSIFLNSTEGEDSVILNGDDKVTAKLSAIIDAEVSLSKDEEDNN